MKRIVTALIVIDLITYRTLFFNMVQGEHDGSYYMKLNNSKDSVYGIIFAILLMFCLDWQDRYSKYFVYIGIAFSIALSIIMLYDWLPSEYSSRIREVTVPFYSCMEVLSVVLFIYLVFYLFVKNKA